MFFAVLIVATTGLELRPALAQQGGEIAGHKLPLAVVPKRERRAAEGDTQDSQWQTGRADGEKPIASLFETPQGTDAAIEVIVGQGRLLTTKKPIVTGKGTAFIAVGDPSIVDFEVLPNPQMIRITGRRPGVTDLSVTTEDGGTYSFEIHVVYDLKLLTAYLRQSYPDAMVRVSQLREHLILEGQARDPKQVDRIVKTVELYLASVRPQRSSGTSRSGGRSAASNVPPQPAPNQEGQSGTGPYVTVGEEGGSSRTSTATTSPQIINLLRVPGVQQVMLQVKIAELDRRGLREVGADLGISDGNGNILGTNIGGAVVQALGLMTPAGIAGSGSIGNSSSNTAFGIFPDADFQVFLRVLRRNSLVNVLAEPNLVAMSGHEASFLAGGQFPVPIPQVTGGVASSVTVEFKDFGVQLDFVPTVLDEEVIRLTVTPEVSTIDESLGTTLVPGGDPVPGLNTRRAATTVELRQGQTLAIAGLLQVTLDATTSRIPFMGDLPYIGPLFSNTGHERTEKELLVLVTPHLVSPMHARQVPPLPGSDVQDPTDCEFYLKNRIEGKSGRPWRSTTAWTNFQQRLIQHERRAVHGPVGYSPTP